MATMPHFISYLFVDGILYELNDRRPQFASDHALNANDLGVVPSRGPISRLEFLRTIIKVRTKNKSREHKI